MKAWCICFWNMCQVSYWPSPTAFHMKLTSIWNLLLMSVLNTRIMFSHGVIIERLESGDTFTNCNKIQTTANCVKLNPWDQNSCENCQCYQGQTYFNSPGQCYVNPSVLPEGMLHPDLECLNNFIFSLEVS